MYHTCDVRRLDPALHLHVEEPEQRGERTEHHRFPEDEPERQPGGRARDGVDAPEGNEQNAGGSDSEENEVKPAQRNLGHERDGSLTLKAAAGSSVVKQTSLILLAVLLLASLSGIGSTRAQSPAPSDLLPPSSIALAPIPRELPPGGSGVVIVQLVDSNRNPSPARAATTVSLFSSDPEIMSVTQQVTIPAGKSHSEAQLKAGVPGTATVTAIASGLSTGTAKVASAVFSDFSLQLVSLTNPASPGDTVVLRVGLIAAGQPYRTPSAVQVSVSASIPGIPQQAAEVEPGGWCAHVNLTLPAGFVAQTAPFMTVTAAASGYASATAAVGISPRAANPLEAIVGPATGNLTAGSRELLSISLFNGSFAPASGSFTFDLFSSNTSVVRPLDSEISLSSEDSATFPVYANATGTAQITALAPGLTAIPVTVTVVEPFKPSLGVTVPRLVRVGENYSIAVGFYNAGVPMPYGPATVYLSSSDSGMVVPQSIATSTRGYATGSLRPDIASVSNITAVMQGASPSAALVTSVVAPVVAPVKYSVLLETDTGQLEGLAVNFTHDETTSTVKSDLAGTATFTTYNDTATILVVPTAVEIGNKTFYFTGWSDGQRSANISLTASAPAVSITAQYFRSVVPTTYSILALSDGQKPLQGLRFNVSSPALGRNFTVTTDQSGGASFVLPNASFFEVAATTLFLPSSQTRFSLLSLANSTAARANITASSSTTFVARYATYYQFEVVSPVGSTSGSGWYRSGSPATYSVEGTSSGGPLVFQRFSGWAGSFSSSQPSGTAIINSPELVKAEWTTDNSILLAASGGIIAAAAVLGLFVFKVKRRAPAR
jgi:hypothetical protein